ncbi:MAG: hypothetical protein KY476_04575 [Planctomycetes bacterium]|nr:hypothetical protein [Planctomycetota bacterium]
MTVYQRPDGDGDQPEHWHEVSLMLLESAEPMDTKSSSRKNSGKKR